MLRIDALTALGRRAEALHALDEIDLGRVPGGLQRRLERAELRAAGGRVREALSDFDAVVAQARERGTLDRALAGRTRAHQRVGDLAAAHADATLYLRRFPDGRFAAQARDIERASP